jgi:hypothetical protein
VLLVLVGAYVTILAWPQLMTAESAAAGRVVIYSDGIALEELQDIAIEVDRRLRASGCCDTSAVRRVFFFESADLFSIYTRLAMVQPSVQGFALSVFGNSYVSAPRIAALAERTGGLPRYSIFEGSPAHTIAHEIGHVCVTDAIGRARWTELPHWKQEGIPEYIANIGIIRRENPSSLSDRVAILLNDSVWDATLGWERHGWDRVHYEAGLLVEYLIEIRGYSPEDITADSVTHSVTLAQMTEWARHQDAA